MRSAAWLHGSVDGHSMKAQRISLQHNQANSWPKCSKDSTPGCLGSANFEHVPYHRHMLPSGSFSAFASIVTDCETWWEEACNTGTWYMAAPLIPVLPPSPEWLFRPCSFDLSSRAGAWLVSETQFGTYVYMENSGDILVVSYLLFNLFGLGWWSR